MGNVEQKVKEQVRRVRIQNALLLLTYSARATTLFLTRTSTMRLLKVIDPYFDEKYNPARRMQQATSRLVARGLLEWHLVDGKRRLQLTQKGKIFAEKLDLENKVRNQRKKKWDGRWRIVSFDIWEKHRSKRDRLRRLLISVGFQKIHASLWAYPYDCEELIAFMRTDLRVGRGVLYFVADAIEGEEVLRKRFNLRGD